MAPKCRNRCRRPIRRAILERGYDAEVGAFTRAFGERAPDVTTLALPLVAFLPADDPRVQSTINAVRGQLQHDGLLYGYLDQDGHPRARVHLRWVASGSSRLWPVAIACAKCRTFSSACVGTLMMSGCPLRRSTPVRELCWATRAGLHAPGANRGSAEPERRRICYGSSTPPVSPSMAIRTWRTLGNCSSVRVIC